MSAFAVESVVTSFVLPKAARQPRGHELYAILWSHHLALCSLTADVQCKSSTGVSCCL